MSEITVTPTEELKELVHDQVVRALKDHISARDPEELFDSKFVLDFLKISNDKRKRMRIDRSLVPVLNGGLTRYRYKDIIRAFKELHPGTKMKAFPKQKMEAV